MERSLCPLLAAKARRCQAGVLPTMAVISNAFSDEEMSAREQPKNVSKVTQPVGASAGVDPGDNFQGLASGQSPAKGPTHPHRARHRPREHVNNNLLSDCGAPGLPEAWMQQQAGRGPQGASSAARDTDTE